MKKLRLSLLSMLMMLIAFTSGASTFVGDRSDFRDETIYYVLTTRFYDGDPSNNWQCWDGVSLNQGDPAWRGDFKGLIEKLDYIKALGFTAVWITPVVTNASGFDYHGYHAFNFSTVDKRLESEDVAFQDLINAVHARGMKIILDIVVNHSGNFGEENLCKMFTRDWSKNQATIYDCMVPYTEKDGGKLPDDYLQLNASGQSNARLSLMNNVDGVNHDKNNYWHHVGNIWSWDDYTRWYAQIAGDCVDLNTENPYVSNYLVRCYGKFIEMGVDGFHFDASAYVSRLTYNKSFLPQFLALAEQHKDKRNGGDFFMYGEVTARYNNVIYRNHQNCSPFFYTWKETNDYAWDDSETSWNDIEVKFEEKGNHTNIISQDRQGVDYNNDTNLPNSDNAFLNGNAYHTPDHTMFSGLSVIDFPMHWNFLTAAKAYSVKYGDQYYNDATYNVVYVDSPDFAPDQALETQRFNREEIVWAENLSLMFTFRGIPCIYYGSEIQFRAGCVIDPDHNTTALSESGRAYYGGYIKGEVNVNDFADYSDATGNIAATLSHPLAQHIRRLNQIRAAVPALRKGQYSTAGCTGNFAFKRRYTDDKVDSYALVTISGNATFTDIENGTYTDVVTGDVKTVTDGSLSIDCAGQGNLRVYVLSTDKTPAPGKIGKDGKYIYGTSPGVTIRHEYDGTQEEKSSNSGNPIGIDNPNPNPDEPSGTFKWEFYFDNSYSNWSTVSAYLWDDSTGKAYLGNWPGTTMTLLEDNMWTTSFTTSDVLVSPKIIFNDGGAGSQTSELDAVNKGVYTSGGFIHTGVSPTAANDLTITVRNGVLYITSAVARDINVVSAFGRSFRYTLKAGQNAIAGLSRGVYVVAGVKVVL